MISDESFRFALDRAFKAQGIKKKTRNELIELYLVSECKERDAILDREEKMAKEAQEREEVPHEAEEQKELVSWFRQTYPDVLIFAIPNGGSRHAREAINLKAQGVLPGVPDLYVPEWPLWIEMKRTKCWELSEEQEKIRRYLIEKCGDYYILGIGFEDAKSKILAFRKKFY